jgi:hypothetical protein
VRALLLVAALLVGCGGKAVLPKGGAAEGFTVLDVGKLPDHGYSGLTLDGDGVLWAVPERGQRLQQLVVGADGLTAGKTLAIADLPDGLDLESLAWLGGDRFVAGTEVKASRSQDAVLVLERGADSVKPVARAILDYSLWMMTAQPNRGIEGICAADGMVVAAVEGVWEESGNRWGLIGRMDVATEQWQPLRVQLTTDTGKLAGLTCRAVDGGIEVHAIERHFGVGRVLKMTLPAWTPPPGPLKLGESTPAPVTVTAEVVADAAKAFGEVPNLEGLAWLGDDLVLLSDNHYGKVTGPTEALRLRP